MKKNLTSLILTIVIPFAALAGPNIQANVASVSFNYIQGAGPSDAKIVTIQSQLTTQTTGTVTITGTADYEVSTDNVTFGNTATVAYTNDVVPPTNIYVRMKAGLSAGNYNNESVSFMFTSSTYGTTVPMFGAVTAACSVTNGSVSSTAASFTWNATGATSYEYIVDQVAADPTVAGTSVSGTSVSVTGLTPSTSYYFHLRGNCGNSNFTGWTSKAFSTVSTGIPETKGNAGVNIFPNPSRGTFTIQGVATGTAPVQVAVINIAGQTIYTAAITAKGEFSQQVELGNANAGGLYFVRIKDDSGYSTAHVIVAK